MLRIMRKAAEQAGNILLRNNQAVKAGSLYKKSFDVVQQIGDQNLVSKNIDKLQQSSISY